MSVLRKPWRAIALILGLVLGAAACQENLAGGAACPSLCPDTLTVKDTLLTASEMIDTEATIAGLPPLGGEQQILIANYTQGGLPIQSVAVLRFDSLVRVFPDTDTTHARRPLESFDSAGVSISVLAPPTGQDTVYIAGDSITFLLYDVDTAAAELDTAAVHAKLAAPPISSITLARDSATGRSVSIPIDSGFIGQHVRAGKRIRLAVAVTNREGKNVRVRINTSDASSGAAALFYVAHADTSRTFVSRTVNTRGSDGGAPIPGLADYMLVLQGTPPPPPGILAAGGIPASRALIRFNLPPQLVDSTTQIVRANLILHQQGSPAFTSTDTMALAVRVVRATPDVSDLLTASLISAAPSSLNIALFPRTIAPTAIQADTIPLVGVFNFWKTEGIGKSQRAILLTSSLENIDPRQYYFYSGAAADPNLRPQLRITYVPKSDFGLP
ncbi:MAG: hypothetical protein IRY91_10315 [Gemmatimonadaceae bacterium]|nr:hypothetical protein [Gemmatimonadaceae bacterium]